MTARDLLPIGEALADLDLVVRQLDDGSLTVARDDRRPDEERVRLTATEAGLVASLRVPSAPGSDSPALEPALEELNRRTRSRRFERRGGDVFCEATLPWGADDLGSAELGRLVDGVLAGAEQAQARLGKGDGPEDQEPALPPMPPSYLPGAGQRPEESLTQRYGAVGAVPGRPELVESPSGAGPRGGGGGLAVIGLLALVGAGVGGFLFVNGRGAPGSAPAPSAQGTPPAPTVDGGAVADAEEQASEGSGPTQRQVGSSRVGLPTRPDARPPTRPVASGSPPRSPRNEAELLEQIVSADDATRTRAVRRWVELELDAKDGARARMLRELDGRFGREVSLLLLESFRARPVGTTEALECLPLAPAGVRRLLIQQLGRPDHANPERVAAALAKLEDTSDLLVDEALIRIGHPRPGVALRLVQVRGLDWVQVGGGRDLLELLPLSEAEPLAGHVEEEVRRLACDILGALGKRGDSDQALTALIPLLRDPVSSVRRRAIEAIRSLKNAKASWPLARALLDEEDGTTRDRVAGALAALPSQQGAAYLARLYQSKRLTDRTAAVLALQAMGTGDAVSALLPALRDPEQDPRLAAIKALQQLQKKPNLRPAVAEGILEIRRLAQTETDRDVRAIARQLHYAISGRMPD